MAMNILCPNCQRPVSVDEQHAGQLLKCPLCGGTFTVPTLPPAAPPSFGTAPAFPGMTSGTVAEPTAETYGLVAEPKPAPAPTGADRAAASTASPRLDKAPASSPWDLQTPLGASPSRPEPPPPPPPGGYVHVRSRRLNPKVVAWTAPAAMVLVFLLTFFPWVGMYPGGEQVAKQNGWQAAFGGHTVDRVYEGLASWERLREGEGEQRVAKVPASGVLIVFVLVLIVAVVATVGACVVESDPRRFQLPPALSLLWPRRHFLVSGLALLLFLLLVLELLKGFPIENKTAAVVDRVFAAQRAEIKSDDGQRRKALQEGETLSAYNLQRTTWLRLTVLLLLVAVVASLLDYWLQRRGNRPLPRVDWMW